MLDGPHSRAGSVKTRYHHEIPLDLHAVLSDLEMEDLKRFWAGVKVGPLEGRPRVTEPIVRQPYDELYVKQKRSRDYWSA